MLDKILRGVEAGKAVYSDFPCFCLRVLKMCRIPHGFANMKTFIVFCYSPVLRGYGNCSDMKHILAGDLKF